MTPTRERGNILFLILLAVILFAALSYAVMGSSRVAEDTKLSDDKARTLAGEIVQEQLMVEKGLERFLLTSAYNDIAQVSLYDANLTRTAGLSGCATSACNLLDKAGGGLKTPLIPYDATDPNITGCQMYNGQAKPFYMIISVGNLGSDAPELVAYYCGVKTKVCEQINIQMGVRAASDTTPVVATFGAAYASFSGTYASPWPTNLTVGQLGTSDARVRGKHDFCYEKLKSSPADTTTGNQYYHVLLVK